MALLEFLLETLQLRSEKSFQDSSEPHFGLQCLQTVSDGRLELALQQ